MPASDSNTVELAVATASRLVAPKSGSIASAAAAGSISACGSTSADVLLGAARISCRFAEVLSFGGGSVAGGGIVGGGIGMAAAGERLTVGASARMFGAATVAGDIYANESERAATNLPRIEGEP